MYINRIEPRVDRIPDKRPSRKESGKEFAAVVESLIEMDVVEIGDSTEDQKKQKKFTGGELPDPEQETPQEEDEDTESGVDIEV